jgi:hypothetical protein
VSVPGASPIVREAEQIEAAPALRAPRSTPPGWTTKVHQAGLLGVQDQTEARQALGQDLKHPPCVLFPLEDQGRIIGEAHHEGAPAQARLDGVLEPTVQDFVQVEIRQQRANYAGNNIAKSRLKWGLRIARARLRGGGAGRAQASIALVVDVALGVDGESR